MTKSPEEYFADQDFSVQAEPDGEITSAERSFLQKYLGMEDQGALDKLGVDVPADALDKSTAPTAAEVAAEAEKEPPIEDMLRNEPELQLVSFVLDGQEFTVPISVVQEVIKFQAPTKLPTAPHFIAGIVNLRGRVTPLVRLRDLLGTGGGDVQDQFIVVCKRRGLQVGLMISEVSTMYRVRQEDMDWNIESHLGMNVQFVSGLMKNKDKLVGVLSVDKIVEKVLKS